MQTIIEKLWDKIHEFQNKNLRSVTAIYLGRKYIDELKAEARTALTVTIRINPKNGHNMLTIFGFQVYEVAKDEEHWNIT